MEDEKTTAKNERTSKADFIRAWEGHLNELHGLGWSCGTNHELHEELRAYITAGRRLVAKVAEQREKDGE